MQRSLGDLKLIWNFTKVSQKLLLAFHFLSFHLDYQGTYKPIFKLFSQPVSHPQFSDCVVWGLNAKSIFWLPLWIQDIKTNGQEND
jgi:hypothetical protein